MKKLSTKAIEILNYLKAAGVGTKLTANEVKTAMGFEKAASVTCYVMHLAKRDLVERFSEEVIDAEGKKKTIKSFALTSAGATYDPDSEVTE